MNKSTNLLFMSILMLSVMISISSNSWFLVWMGMEMNIMSFIPMILKQNNLNSKEASLTYFMVQTIASMLLMMSFIMMMLNINKNNMNNTGEMLLTSSIMMKGGISPFHFWLPKMMEGINWISCTILMTWQKIIPMMLLSNMMKINMITITAMIMSIIIGAIGGLNQTSLRKLMAYSSISNSGWMLLAMMISETMWLTYFAFYMLMTITFTLMVNKHKIYHMNQLMSMNETTLIKFMLMLNMLSISGLPPMMGFLPKWMIIQSTMSSMQITIMTVMVMLTLVTIFYYLRIMFSALMMSNIELKWNLNTKMNTKTNMMLAIMSIMGLTTITMMISLY
uniref:NADH-ubiquinone oxidoreductase chain 2 n=1 Tax=Ramulus mikado TaxID=2823491 RepID=E2RUU4_9NEOP|nr:NADH dehydrogenase subunit 2 [Ramulus irregulariterdentatus]BAJ24478.1 NADH dehydrogenase subunit 2 [Ramulus irregulariterdentatus]